MWVWTCRVLVCGCGHVEVLVCGCGHVGVLVCGCGCGSASVWMWTCGSAGVWVWTCGSVMCGCGLFIDLRISQQKLLFVKRLYNPYPVHSFEKLFKRLRGVQRRGVLLPLDLDVMAI